MFVIAIILFLILFSGVIYCAQRILFKGEIHWLLYFLCIYLPFYLTLQILAYQYTGSILLVNLLKYLKEIMVLLTLLSWLIYKRDLFRTRLSWYLIDYLFLVFIVWVFIYAIAPIGSSVFVNKILYFKNILMLVLMYFLGRIMVLDSVRVKHVVNIILMVTLLAFITNLTEKVFNTHLQSIIEYTVFNEQVNDIGPRGSYGLSYTFGSESGSKRFAAFFANPLDLASAMLLSCSVSIFFVLNSKSSWNHAKYTGYLILSVSCLLFSYSRSPLGGVFLMLFFIAVILGYYRFIIYGFISLAILFGGIFIFAGENLKYFVVDTFSLVDSSSLGHVVEWIEGIESMSSNPLGIGLGTSGNSGGVDEDLKIGGENQFVIFGVQLGVPFLVLYIFLLGTAIYTSIKSYRLASSVSEKVIPFIAATFKVAFLFPLMTSNAENYLYVAYISWWMVGYSISLYGRNKASAKILTQSG